MKRMMKMTLAGLLFSSSAAFAAGAGEAQTGFLIYLFLGFGALIVAFQLVPALILFATMIKEFFSSPVKRANVVESGSGAPKG
ncbi:MAG: hypothetical protein WDA20_12745 [Desulfuromonadales bacterium]|jgi:hypothetical protein